MTLRARLERLEERQRPAAVLLCLVEWNSETYALRYYPGRGTVRELATGHDLRQPVKRYADLDPDAV